jgi:site-specific DNA-methyltransferase (adenine-specific)
LFVEKALNLDPRYAVFVTPSRWMAGGKGLDKYRERMLSDKRLRNISYPSNARITCTQESQTEIKGL